MHERSLQLIPVTSTAQVAEISALASEIWLEHYPAIIGLEQTEYMIATLQSAPAIASHIERGARYFLLVHAGASAGYAAIEVQRESATLFVSKLYLRRALRGRGLGQRALDAIATLARDEHLARLELTVNKRNELALRAYTRFGMTIEGTRLTEIGAGFAMDDYVLSLTVRG